MICTFLSYLIVLSIIWIAPFSDAVRSKDVDRNFAKCSIHARRTVHRYRLWSLKPEFSEGNLMDYLFQGSKSGAPKFAPIN